MKLIKKMTISIVVLLMMLTISACGEEMTETEMTDPTTGTINEETAGKDAKTADSTGKDIGEAEAKKLVLAKVNGATEADIHEFEKDYDNGKIEYEGSIYYDGYEYEFEVDGATGNIIQWEIDKENF